MENGMAIWILRHSLPLNLTVNQLNWPGDFLMPAVPNLAAPDDQGQLWVQDFGSRVNQ